MTEEKKKSYGLWKHTSKNNIEYLKGKVVINGIPYKVVVFSNSKKSKENQPDFSLIID